MELHYFLTTNGSQGHTSYLADELSRYDNVIRLEGYPKELAAKLVRECYLEAKKHETDIEVIHNPLDNSPEGILLPAFGAALINTPLYDMEFGLINLMINEPLNLYQKHMDKAFKFFKEALSVHDEWEDIYKKATDYPALDAFTSACIDRLLEGKSQDKTGCITNRFFGSATINGSVDYVEVLSQGLKRYLIKGRPGTGKSTFMKKLAKRACEQGFFVECYHCSFDPHSLDMVVIRELGFCLFDATPPHEYAPTLDDDEVIDLYQAAVETDTDIKFTKEISVISRAYKDNINAAVKHIMLANDALRDADTAHMKKINNDRVMLMLQKIIKTIFAK